RNHQLDHEVAVVGEDAGHDQGRLAGQRDPHRLAAHECGQRAVAEVLRNMDRERERREPQERSDRHRPILANATSEVASTATMLPPKWAPKHASLPWPGA